MSLIGYGICGWMVGIAVWQLFELLSGRIFKVRLPPQVGPPPQFNCRCALVPMDADRDISTWYISMLTFRDDPREVLRGMIAEGFRIDRQFSFFENHELRCVVIWQYGDEAELVRPSTLERLIASYPFVGRPAQVVAQETTTQALRDFLAEIKASGGITFTSEGGVRGWVD